MLDTHIQWHRHKHTPTHTYFLIQFMQCIPMTSPFTFGLSVSLSLSLFLSLALPQNVRAVVVWSRLTAWHTEDLNKTTFFLLNFSWDTGLFIKRPGKMMLLADKLLCGWTGLFTFFSFYLFWPCCWSPGSVSGLCANTNSAHQHHVDWLL